MEDMTVVFFYVDKQGEERCGQDKEDKERRKSWEKIRRKIRKRRERNLISPKEPEQTAHLKGISWKYCEEAKRFVVQNTPIPPEGRYVYYAPNRQAEKLLGRGREPIGMEWILFLLAYYEVTFDGLVLIQDREMEAEELIRYFAPRVAYLGVVADFFFDWDEVEEGLSEEYGLVLDIAERIEELHIKGERLLVIGAGRNFVAGGMQAAEIVWLDTAGRCENREMLRKSATNFTYLNIESFLRDTLLDTAHKIKYNNTR